MSVRTQFAFRTLKGIGVVNGAPSYEPLPGFEKPQGNLRCCVYSPCGRYFAWAAPESVSIINADTGAIISTLPAENVFELGFSPLGTYVITWQRPSKDENGDAVKNLKVWLVNDEKAAAEGVDKEPVARFVQKSQTGWNLQYTYDEAFCARVVTNEVQIYESHDLTNVWNKIRVEGVADFAVSPGKNHAIAVFVPERKGQPAAVRVYSVPNFTNPVSQKNFFKGDKVQLKWNDNGTSLIVLAQTEVDKTGKSYYGETTLYLLSANGGFDSRIDLDKEGPIHDVAWSPKSNSFAVVYGYMPAKTVIFNAKAQPVHSFPLAPRNTVLFSPHGRFVLVAGFGNLAGQMDIYDLEKDMAKICTIEASNASVCEWSPDGLHILTATTSPRLRVDNGIRIWHAGGPLMYNEDMNELYHVCWRPQPASQHPLPANPFSPMPVPHPSAVEYMAARKTPSKPAGAYRPPGARGQVTPLAFKREDEGGAAYVRGEGVSSFSNSVNGFGKPRQRIVPGAEPVEGKAPLPPGAAPGGGVSLTGTGEGADDEHLSKAAKKNAKKREAKKAAAAAAAAKGESGTGTTGTANLAAPEHRGKSESRSPDGRGHQRSRSRNYVPPPPGLEPPTGPKKERSRSNSRRQRRDSTHNHANGTPKGPAAQSKQPRNGAPTNINTTTAPTNAASQAQQAPPELEVTSPVTPGGSSQDKKVRGLLKKIRAIEDLKMRFAGGEKLEDTQMRKISTEDAVRKELAGLGYNG
ncbi:translation initiation factor eIF-2A, partial [Aureobasidium melanogenum]